MRGGGAYAAKPRLFDVTVMVFEFGEESACALGSSPAAPPRPLQLATLVEG
jgi:hypothetical protein